jgi:ABC-type multidrug transport system fused ATPase/permease subunit
MDCQKRARDKLRGKPGFVFFDEQRFNPGRSVAENILNAMRRFDRKPAWKLLSERMEAAIRAAGLRDDLIRLGLGAPAGSGGSNLSATARRRVALARAMLKRPSLLVLDGVAGGRSPADAALRDRIRAALPETTLIFAVEHPEDVAADCVIEIGDDGAARLRPAGEAGQATVEPKRRQSP